jgi:hypothetical protein
MYKKSRTKKKEQRIRVTSLLVQSVGRPSTKRMLESSLFIPFETGNGSGPEEPPTMHDKSGFPKGLIDLPLLMD